MNVLMVDDDEELLNIILLLSQKEGNLHIDAARTVSQALSLISQSRYSCMIIDLHLSGNEDGITCYKLLRNVQNIPIIFMSANKNLLYSEKVSVIQPSALLPKPFRWEALHSLLTRFRNECSN